MAGELPAGVVEVKRVKAPGGPDAYWVLGTDGGVFAIGGAPYLGSYMGYVTEGGLTERFDFSKGNITTSQGGGYTLTATSGHQYTFDPKVNPATTATGGDAVAAPPPEAISTSPTGEAADAKAVLENTLAKYGLGALAGQAWDQYNTSKSVDLTMSWVRQQEPYKQRFAGLEMRRKNPSMPDLTEEEYIQWENTAKELMRKYEMPTGFYDGPEDFARFIANDVSPAELASRIENGYAAAMNAPQETRDELSRMFGVKPGELAAFFLDPDKGAEALVRQRTQAELSGAAVRSGFGGLSIEEAERLRTRPGMSTQMAEQGFDQLDKAKELTLALESNESELSREEQLKFAAGEGQAQEELRRRSRQRAARFEGGGGFAGGQSGLSGLGSAP